MFWTLAILGIILAGVAIWCTLTESTDKLWSGFIFVLGIIIFIVAWTTPQGKLYWKHWIDPSMILSGVIGAATFAFLKFITRKQISLRPAKCEDCPFVGHGGDGGCWILHYGEGHDDKECIDAWKALTKAYAKR